MNAPPRMKRAPSPRDNGRASLNLRFAFHAAWPSHRHNAWAANLYLPYFYDRSGGIEVPARQLVRRDDAMTFFDAFECLQYCWIEIVLRTHPAKHRVPYAG